MEDTSDLDESFLKTSGNREDHAMKIRCLPKSHSQPQYKETKSNSGLRTPILHFEDIKGTRASVARKRIRPKQQ